MNDYWFTVIGITLILTWLVTVFGCGIYAIDPLHPWYFRIPAGLLGLCVGILGLAVPLSR